MPFDFHDVCFKFHLMIFWWHIYFKTTFYIIKGHSRLNLCLLVNNKTFKKPLCQSKVIKSKNEHDFIPHTKTYESKPTQWALIHNSSHCQRICQLNRSNKIKSPPLHVYSSKIQMPLFATPLRFHSTFPAERDEIVRASL